MGEEASRGRRGQKTGQGQHVAEPHAGSLRVTLGFVDRDQELGWGEGWGELGAWNREECL